MGWLSSGGFIERDLALVEHQQALTRSDITRLGVSSRLGREACSRFNVPKKKLES